MKGSPAEIETPTYWDLISSSTTVSPPMSWPNSNLPPPSSHGAFIIYSRKENNGALFNHIIISLFLL
jgi:hypothetical protein